MCGIAGFIDLWDGNKTKEHGARTQLLDAMCRIILHRGPDDQGMFVRDGVALGMRRLSIIDLAGGHQPISGEDGSVTIVYNGEVYNFLELKPRLEALGHEFRTRSDTETIVHAYEQFGHSCLDHLRGMFAFAIWDARKREIFIARDRAGKKPLYYTITPTGTLVFASELKSLLLYPDVQREINPLAVDAYLTLGYVPDPLTIFRDIHKLPPGCYLTFSERKLNIKQYWDFNFEPNESVRPEDYVEELRYLLDESVRLRLISDVPLGAFLSGGIDSSTVVALMARNMGQPVKTFSIGFNEDNYDELKYARLTAKHVGSDHHEFIVTPDICDVVDKLVLHLDEPFADQAAIPNYMVAKMARDYVTVVLSGDGGDELFAGYTRYVTDQKRHRFARLPRIVRERLVQPISGRLPHGAFGRNYLYNISLDPIDRYLDSVSVFTSLNKRSLYSQDFRRQIAGRHKVESMFKELADRVQSGQALDRLLYIDCKTYLPGDILSKVDRTSMAASLEVRVPLLDHKLIDFVTRIPASLKLAGSETKHLLKQGISDLIPNEILNRPKQGFGVPIQEWINSQLRDRIRETLADQRTRQRGYVEPSYVDLLLDEHERGRRDHSNGLWALMMLELWFRSFVDQSGNVALTKTSVTQYVPVVA